MTRDELDKRNKEYTRECIELYNKEGGVKGFNTLTQVHDALTSNKELAKQSFDIELETLKNSVRNYCSILEDEIGGNKVPEGDYFISDLEHLLKSFDTHFSEFGWIVQYESRKVHILARLNKAIERSFEKSDKEIDQDLIKELINTHFENAETYFNRFYILKYYTLVSKFVLNKIIDSGFKKRLNVGELMDEVEQEVENNIGRPYDKSAPQNEIEKKVLELASNPEYLRNGKAMPTKIRDELINNYPELCGLLKESAMFDRVKKALKNNNIR